LRDAEERVRVVDKERLPWAKAIVTGGRAAISLLRGNRTGAASLLETCIAQYRDLGMDGYSFTGKRHLGRIVGGDRGREWIQESETWLRAHGVVDLDRFANRCLPMRVPGDTIT
jgi:hypothetical protein